MESIVAQTFTEWECLAFDNFSDDGSWEVINAFAKQDSRIIAAQAPRQGMYANWNNCIREANGDYIYIATSDDTMSPDCLEKMRSTLDSHPECDICQCGLQMIDREGLPMIQGTGGKSWETLANTAFYGGMLKTAHIRRAPYDGLVALAYGTAWTSMTQVLIRRSLFDRIGLFPTQWAGVGDAAWQMRAGLVANVAYIPEKLATWRYYEGQGSGVVHEKALREGWFARMGAEVIEWFRPQNANLARKIETSGILDFFRVQHMAAQLHEIKTPLRPRQFLKIVGTDPASAGNFFKHYFQHKLGFPLPSRADHVRSIIKSFQF